MEWFIYRIRLLFFNPFELIKKCNKVLYATTISQIIDSMDDFESAIKYADYFDYNSLEIKFFHWEEYESVPMYFPSFVKKLIIKVSQREDIIYCNIYINDIYIGNLYFSFPIEVHVLFLSSDLDEEYVDYFQASNGNALVKTMIRLILFSFAYVNENYSNQTVYNAIDEIHFS